MKRSMAYPSQYPPEVGAGSGGGTTENNAAVSGAASTGGVTSGTASDAMIAAFAASSAAEEASTSEEAVGEEEPAGTGDTAAAGTTASAATPGATGSQVPTGAAAKGPVPFDRHEAAVKNARDKAVQETEQRLGWAKDYQQDDVRVAFNIASALLDDTPGFAAKLAAEIGMKLVPLAETSAAAPASAAPTGAAFKIPRAELRSEDGKGAFSEEQMNQILTDFAAHLETRFGERVKPLETMRTQLTEQEQKTRIREEAQASVKEMLADFRARPHFMTDDGKGGKVEHPSILRNLREIPATVRAKIGAEAAMSRAYSKYLQEEVFPNITTTAAAQVRDEMARKARGSSGNASPAGATGAGTGVTLKDGDVAGLAAHMQKLATSPARQM